MHPTRCYKETHLQSFEPHKFLNKVGNIRNMTAHVTVAKKWF